MYQRIFVAVDGSPTSARGLAEAIGVAGFTRGRILLAHVVEEPAREDTVADLHRRGEATLDVARAQVEAAGLNAETCLLDGAGVKTSEALLVEADAWRADLVVVGTHGRRGVARLLLGSDAEQIVRTARVPVLLVRAIDAAAAAGVAGVATA